MRCDGCTSASTKLQPDPQRPFLPAPPGAVASMNTHDMPTFTAFWRGLDIDDRQGLGLLDDNGVRYEQNRRRTIREAIIDCLRRSGLLGDAQDETAVLSGCLQYIACGEAGFVMATLEDLWKATEPQNVPGTWREKPNWRRRAAHALEEFDKLPAVRETLLALDRAMRSR